MGKGKYGTDLLDDSQIFLHMICFALSSHASMCSRTIGRNTDSGDSVNYSSSLEVYHTKEK